MTLRSFSSKQPASLSGAMASAFTAVVDRNLMDRSPRSRTADIFREHDDAWRLDTDAAAQVARRGLKAQVVEDWLAVSRLPKKGFYDGLRLSPSTLSRKGRDQPLDAAVTERLVRQSDLMVRATEVFGEGAAAWMTKAHPLLGGLSPLDVASNEYGGTQVREILNAIHHGGVV